MKPYTIPGLKDAIYRWLMFCAPPLILVISMGDEPSPVAWVSWGCIAFGMFVFVAALSIKDQKIRYEVQLFRMIEAGRLPSTPEYEERKAQLLEDRLEEAEKGYYYKD